MPELIAGPTLIEAGGAPPKTIQEYVGRVNRGTLVVDYEGGRLEVGAFQAVHCRPPGGSVSIFWCTTPVFTHRYQKG